MPEIVELDMEREADFARWQRFVLGRDDTTFADAGAWRRIFRELYGIRDVTLACTDGDATLGAASLYLIASPFFGRLLVSSPFFGYGGLYADDPQVKRALLDRIEVAARELNADFIELRLREAVGPPYAVGEDFLEFDLPLGGSEEETWSGSLTSNARQNVRKAAKHGLAFSTTGDPGEPFLLLCRTLRDLGTPFHSRRLFDLMVEHLGDDLCFSRVHEGRRLVAAGVMVRFRDRMATPYIGGLKHLKSLRANYCQYWGIIRYCVEHGLRQFDLGRSPRDSSVVPFKKKWGALPVTMQYCHRAVSGRRQYRNVLGPSRLELLASDTWKRLPLALTRRVGHWAARYIP